MRIKHLVPLFLLSTQIFGLSFDLASDYTTSTWISNSFRGGHDFNNWFLGSGSANSGRFIGSSTAGAADIDTDGRSFALFGHSGTSMSAVRSFAKPTLTTGDALSFQVAVNFRNGDKGFNLRDPDGNHIWLFRTGRENNAGGYFVRNGSSAQTGSDDGQQLGGYHANTVFTFTFTQRERTLDWTIERTGGIQSTLTGSAPIASGTFADVRFFISNTENSDPQNNLYFNNFTFKPAVRGNAPLTPGERRLPGFEPSHFLRYTDPAANSVTLRTQADWNFSHPLTLNGDVWEIDIRTLNLSPGWYNFKFRVNSAWEPGTNRLMYIRADGKIAKPPAVYLIWQRDPDTTMTVHWHTYDTDNRTVQYRLPGSETWLQETGSSVDLPYSERFVQTVELTGLEPDTHYEFRIPDSEETYTFRTLPSTLIRPVIFGETGDVLYGADADAMAIATAARDPDFLVIGGDLAYSDGRADLIWIEYRYFESFYTHFRAPDGRMIPKVVGVGNHEMRNHYLTAHPDFEETPEWRDRVAPYFFKLYAFPGQPGYNVLDVGDYLSFIVLDTGHLNPVTGTQTDWLAAQLDSRREVPHLFPVYHVPAYPSHRSENDALNTTIRNTWLPLFEQAGVRLAFEHHDHTYKRTHPILGGSVNSDGIVFLGDGAWGVATRPVKNPATTWFLADAQPRHHAFIVTLSPEGRLIEAIDKQGVVFDSFTQGIDGIPAAPDAEITLVSDRRVHLGWQESERTTGYEVWRDGALLQALDLHARSFQDADLAADTVHLYHVRALNRSGPSPAAELPVRTLLPPQPPQIPQAPAATDSGARFALLEWPATPAAESYRVFRNGEAVADVFEPRFADSGLIPESEYSYTVQARNSAGDSAQSPPLQLSTPAAPAPLSLDGARESPGYLLSSSGGMHLYAAIRDSELYVATWTPAGGQADHFIFVSDHLLPTPSRRVPWAKLGMLPLPRNAPFLAAESNFDYIAWFNAPPSSAAFRSGTAGGLMEGRINLIEAFGRLPERLFLAVAAYATPDGGGLLTQGPGPAQQGNLTAETFWDFPLPSLIDSDGGGTLDVLNPARRFRLEVPAPLPGAPLALRWPVLPGRDYQVFATPTLAPADWQPLFPEALSAPAGAEALEVGAGELLPGGSSFYRIELLNPHGTPAP